MLAGFPNSKATGAADYDWEKSGDSNPVHKVNNIKSGVHYADEGSAARYFYNCANPQPDDALIYSKGIGKVRHSPSDYGDAGSAARFFYCSKASPAERKGNPHPTVKPLELMKYLVKLVKQPERNLILDPFAGSDSTLIVCQMLSIPCIGIELSEEYCEIVVKRLQKK